MTDNSLDNTILLIKQAAGTASRIVFVSGDFNIIHPGHLRLLNFAADCGDFLIVGVSNDNSPGAFISQALRLEGVRGIVYVNFAFGLSCTPEEFIRLLQPHIVVKGNEHENNFNPEQDIVDGYGGKLLFSSGEMRFSSLNLLKNELSNIHNSEIFKPTDYLTRHSFSFQDLIKRVNLFQNMRVLVIGDLIIDEYITCDPLGMSQEDPTIVVTPIQHDLFVGGAGIVAAHAKGLGAEVHYLSVVGTDQSAEFARERLREYGVVTTLYIDESRPTTLKQRYRAQGKTLLRVSHLRQHAISQQICAQISMEVSRTISSYDLVIFSDFNYGVLPQLLVDKIIKLCTRHQVMMVADSQSSSQFGDVSRFRGCHLITPTEREARLAIRDHGYGLVKLADLLRRKANSQHLFVKLGAEGMLVYSPDSKVTTDLLPAMNRSPRDVSGAGDSLLTCSSMALASGASIWESAYLGSIAAACQVSRIGNSPITVREIINELQS